jgi:hypothetical protein
VGRYAEDEHGTGIEVYPDGTVIVAGEGEQIGHATLVEPPPKAIAFHRR